VAGKAHFVANVAAGAPIATKQPPIEAGVKSGNSVLLLLDRRFPQSAVLQQAVLA
jgi:hypothetical protein